MPRNPEHPPRDSNLLINAGGKILSSYFPTVMTVAEMGVFLGSKIINVVKEGTFKNSFNLEFLITFTAQTPGGDTPIAFQVFVVRESMEMIGTWQRTITDDTTAALGEVISGTFTYTDLTMEPILV